MKKIGIIYGMEHSFPEAIVDYINSKNSDNYVAEFCNVDAVSIDEDIDFDVILDRATNDVPYYRSYLKLATSQNVRVVNIPFRNNVGDAFFYTALIKKLGVKVPKTVVLPTKNHPPGTNGDAMKNLAFPVSWDKVFSYVGFPSCLRPNTNNPNLSEYKVYNPDEFFTAYDMTGSNVFTLTECIDYDSYFRCFVIGKEKVRIIHFDPTKPLHLRYEKSEFEIDPKLKRKLEKNAKKVCEALNRDFNAVEFAVKDGDTYAVEYLNTAPKSEKEIMHPDDFDWLVENTGDYLISLTKERKSRVKELSWGSLLEEPKKKTGTRKK